MDNSKGTVTDRSPDETIGLAHVGNVINTVAMPIAIFNANRGLVQSNPAYAALWRLDPNWLQPGMDERLILDRLRTLGMLPPEPDYQAWRARHLQSYTLKVPRESEPWYLPDGRVVQVISAPASPEGGVIYVFEDITNALMARSQHQAMLDVQRSTLNALAEGVAVFGTNGRLTLSNPQFAGLWRVTGPILDSNPHVDALIARIGEVFPSDAQSVWKQLKSEIVDLSPTRTDRSGRIARSDGRTIDYALTRMPDGQTMLTFVDVTESANYQKVVQERNEALLVAAALRANAGSGGAGGSKNAVGGAQLDNDQRDFMASLRDASLDPELDARKEIVPNQRPGLAFVVGEENLLDLAMSGPPTENEYAELGALRPIVYNILDEIIALSAGSNAFPQISGIAHQYKAALGLDIGPMSIDQLYAHGIRLSNLTLRLKRSAALGDIPEQPDGLGEALESLLGIHGTMVLTTTRGRQLLDAARQYAGSQAADIEYKVRALEFAERVAASTGVTTREAGDIMLAVNTEVGSAPSPERSTQVARTANYNLLAAAGKVVLLGGMGTVVSSSLITSIPGGAAVSVGVELFNACWYFILNNEQLLRGLAASAGQELLWIDPLLDFMRAGRKDYLKRWSRDV